MAETQLSPQLSQAVQAFAQKYPDFDLSSGNNPFGPLFRNGKSGADPMALRDFLVLRGQLDREGFHFSGNGDPKADMATWKKILLGAAVVGAPIAGYAAMGGFAGAGGASGASAAGGAGSYIGKAIKGTEAAVQGAAGASGIGSILRQLAEAGIPIGTLLATRAMGGGGPSEPAPMSPELQEALSLALQRLKDQQPLQDAVNRQALAGLPAYAKGGA